MRADILSIGDELLIGQTINTNASWLGKELSSRGIRIMQTTAIPDDKDLIKKAIDEALTRSELVVITGGLGPTKDDITKYTLCEYFDTELEIHLPTLVKIENYFSQRNRPMLEVNIKQAELPKSCEILNNDYGTAAGMWFEKNGKIVISLPGVPYEMKGIMMEEAIPRLKERFEMKSLYHVTMMTQGIGESFLAEYIKDWEDKVRSSGLGLAYLPSPGMVKLRLTSYEGEERQAEIDQLFKEVENLLPQHVYSYGDVSLTKVLGDILRQKGMTIGTAESCTGGALAAELVSIPGSSDYFSGGILTYSNKLKQDLAEVKEADLIQFGAVSREVVEQMALNGLKKLGVDVCISTSGVAGPTGGSDEKPVGTVWIAIALKNRVVSRIFRFGDNRERNIQMTVLSALNFARCEILDISSEKK